MAAANDHLTAVLVYERAFSAAECRRIREHAATLPDADVDVYPPPATPTRRATSKLIDGPGECGWVRERLWSVARSANERYRFALEDDVRPLLFVAYGPGGFFDWHTDLGDGAESTRKISISLQLSSPHAYDGGALQIVSHERALPIGEAGTLTVFPSHLAHRVLPIERGERLALVTWVHGPPFR